MVWSARQRFLEFLRQRGFRNFVWLSGKKLTSKDASGQFPQNAVKTEKIFRIRFLYPDKRLNFFCRSGEELKRYSPDTKRNISASIRPEFHCKASLFVKQKNHLSPCMDVDQHLEIGLLKKMKRYYGSRKVSYARGWRQRLSSLSAERFARKPPTASTGLGRRSDETL